MLAVVRRLASVCALGLAAAGCAHETKTAAPKPPSVATSVASFGTITPSQQLPGIVAPSQSVAIQSDLTEPTDSVSVQEGDHVTKGQVLAVLDTADLRATLAADLAQAHSDAASATHSVYAGNLSIAQGTDSVRGSQQTLAQANATLERDETDLSRYSALLHSGYISEQQVATQRILVRNDEAAIKAAQASLASARSNVTANGTLDGAQGGLQSSSVEQARATQQVALAQADQVRTQIAKATIVSPIDGVVVNRNLNPGEYPGTRQLFTIQNVDPVFAILRGSGGQIAEIAAGARATIVATDLGRRALTGRVVGVLNQINPGSTDFQVKVTLPNPSGRLRPGMAILGSVTTPPVRGVRIPETAFTDDSHDQILMVDDKGTVHVTKVTELANAGPTAVVDGITNGARVVTDGQTSVGDGQKIAMDVPRGSPSH